MTWGPWKWRKCLDLKDILESGAGVDVSQYGTNWHKTTDKSSTLMARDYKGFGNQCQTGVAVPCAMRTRKDELGKFKRLETKDDYKANSLTFAEPITNRSLNNLRIPNEKANCLLSSSWKGAQANGMTNVPERVGQLGKGGQGERIYSIRGKSVCLNANGGGLGAKTGLYKVDLPDGDYIIRKLTPVECERLQTMPDGWTGGASNTQRYKMLGNGWTVDVIAHIFKGLKSGN